MYLVVNAWSQGGRLVGHIVTLEVRHSRYLGLGKDMFLYLEYFKPRTV
jgi:hypothetical protein